MKKIFIVIALVLIALIAAIALTGWNPMEWLSGDKSQQAISETVSLGYVAPLTGPAVTYSEVQKKAVEIALSEVNSGNVLEGKTLQVLWEDSKLDPSVAVTAMKKLIDVNKASVVFGFSSGEVLSMATVANRTQTVLLAPMASAAQISDAGDYVFRLSPSDAFQGQVLAKVVQDDGKETAAILYVNNDWGAGLQKSFKTYFENDGGQVIMSEPSNPDDKDFRTQISKIQSAAPDAIVLFLHPNEAMHAVRQAREVSVASALYGGDTFSADAIYQGIPKLAEGIVFTLPAQPDSPEFLAFAKAYQAKFNESPDINAAVGYDAVKLIAQVISEVGNSAQAICQHLKTIKGYKGASGEVTFDANGDVISKKYETFIIQDGKYRPRQ